MSRYILPLVVFAAAWIATMALVMAFYNPEIVADYVRAGVISAYFAIAGLVVFIAVLHRLAHRRQMRNLLVWGMGVAYLLSTGTVALGLWERLGEPLSYRSAVLALSLLLALCWLVPLVRYVQHGDPPQSGRG